MENKSLWKKLFVKKTTMDEINLMVSGAMVRHRNPFEDLDVPRNYENLSKEFIDKWVVPYYFKIHSNIDQATILSLTDALKEINLDIVEKLLGDFNWRTRICGAFFAGVKNYEQLQHTIGKHLLKSEVCFAGKGYCLALASFNTTISIEYLSSYLEYYLIRKDLWFDQAEAYCALAYLGSSNINQFNDRWNEFVSDKPNWNLDRYKNNFHINMDALKKISSSIIM